MSGHVVKKSTIIHITRYPSQGTQELKLCQFVGFFCNFLQEKRKRNAIFNWFHRRIGRRPFICASNWTSRVINLILQFSVFSFRFFNWTVQFNSKLMVNLLTYAFTGEIREWRFWFRNSLSKLCIYFRKNCRPIVLE